ncbi:MAG: hypothetical protein WAL80_17690 [Xanthobacteraceae bacterium]|jgi:hypothetical protein
MTNNFFFSTVYQVLTELTILIRVSNHNMKYVEAMGGPDETADDPDKEEAISQSKLAIAFIENAGRMFAPLKCEHIDSALKRLVRWREQQPHIWSELNTRSRSLRDALEIELKQYLYYQYPQEKGGKLRAWEKDWEAAIKAFPDIRQDSFNATDCFALGHGTASVFHAMRVAEHGLRALAKERRVRLPKNKPIEWATWQDIIKALDAEIVVIGGKKAGAAKDAALEFYSGARADLNGFKDEYRNLVMHVRASYDDLQALRALTKVHAFMERLAAKLDHKGTRIRWGLR